VYAEKKLQSVNLSELLSSKDGEINFEKWVGKFETAEGTAEEKEELRMKLITKGKQ